MNNYLQIVSRMDLDVVQARINEAINPLLKRIQALEEDNKDLRNMVEQLITTKTGSNVKPQNYYNKLVNKPPTSYKSKQTIDKKQEEVQKFGKGINKEDSIENINNPYSNQSGVVTKHGETSKTTMYKKESNTSVKNIGANKKATTGNIVKHIQVDRLPAAQQRGKAQSKKQKNKEPQASKKDEMKKIEELIEEAAKNQQNIQLLEVQKKEPVRQEAKKLREEDHHKMKEEPKKSVKHPKKTAKKKEMKHYLEQQQQNSKHINWEKNQKIEEIEDDSHNQNFNGDDHGQNQEYQEVIRKK